MSEKSEHAEFGGSTAKIWTTCTAHPTAVRGLPNESGPSALEGTVAHHVFRLVLTPKSGVETAHDLIGKIYRQVKDEKGHNKTVEISEKRIKEFDIPAKLLVKVTQEMADAVQSAIDDTLTFIAENVEAHEKVEILLEAPIAAPGVSPDFYGTADVLVLIYGRDGKPVRAIVVDYKHGVRYFVEAEYTKGWSDGEHVWRQNHQLAHYSVCVQEQYKVEFVLAAIAQPRCIETDENGEERPKFRKTQFDALALAAWREHFTAKIVECRENPRYCPSEENCLWCVAKEVKGRRCPGLETQISNVVEAAEPLDIAVVELPPPEELTPEKLSVVLKNGGLISQWYKVCKAYAIEQAGRGVKIPDFTAARGKPGHRRWANADEAREGLLMCYSEDQIVETTLASPTEIERRLGKEATANLRDLIIRPEGEMTLVPEGSTKGKIAKKQAADTSVDGFTAVEGA